jgi:hypothetical protein
VAVGLKNLWTKAELCSIEKVCFHVNHDEDVSKSRNIPEFNVLPIKPTFSVTFGDDFFLMSFLAI